MSTNAYLERLNQLKEERVQSVAQKAAPLGLPSQRPGMPTQTPEKQMLGVPPKQEEEQQPDSQFMRNLENFKGQDARFGDMMSEYTNLAMGLREQVNAGYMPMKIAEQKLQQFLGDSSKHFTDNAPKATDNPEVRGMLEGLMQQQMGGVPEGSPAPQEGAPMPPQEQPMGGMPQ